MTVAVADRDIHWCSTPNGHEPGKKVSDWKFHLGEKCPHGLDIFLVNGTYVRNHYDSDFVQGGNGFRYRFCPKGELWIEMDMPSAEWAYVGYHECYETEKMREGWSYERAHDAAKRAENKMRRAHKPGEGRR